MRSLGRNLLQNRLLQEVLVFSALFILLTLNSWTAIKAADALLKAVTYFFVLYVHAQLHRFLLIPLLEERKRPVLYAVCAVALLLLFSWFLYATDDYWFKKKYGGYQGSLVAIYIYHMGTCALSLIAILVPFLLIRYFNEQKKRSVALLAMNKVELKMLRSQLNPHFLFNAFNNIYGLSLNNDSRVPALLQHVSKLMRYQLENNTKEWIPLEEELGYIESYIALEEERLGSRCDIRYEYANNQVNDKHYIAPLVLISFIENAFKHGTFNIARSFVHISITVNKNIFDIKITNSMPLQGRLQGVGGIGLHNAMHILDIIYPSKYTLSKVKDETKYSVCLTLPLITGKNAE